MIDRCNHIIVWIQIVNCSEAFRYRYHYINVNLKDFVLYGLYKQYDNRYSNR